MAAVSLRLTETYLNERASHSSKSKFLTALEKVPDVKPEEFDKL